MAEAIVEDLKVKQALYAELTRSPDRRRPREQHVEPDAVSVSRADQPARTRAGGALFQPWPPDPSGGSVRRCRKPRRDGRDRDAAPACRRQDAGNAAQRGAGLHREPLMAACCARQLALVEDGVCTMEDLDAVVSLGFGRRLAAFGPFTITDMAGLDVWQAITSYLYPLISDTKSEQHAPRRSGAQGDLGLKSGRGFYEWTPTEAAAALALCDAELLRDLIPHQKETPLDDTP